MTVTNLQRLTDAEILQIFRTIDEWPGAADGFVKAFAHAVTRAPRRDFMAMRSLMLLFIGKYNLGSYLTAEPQEKSA
jgi:hypothetical protein